MKLNETVEMMNSEDYKERFRAEYFQLKIRYNSLYSMLMRMKADMLDFTPKCSYDLLNAQLKAMKLYAEYLIERAEIEGIELEDIK